MSYLFSVPYMGPITFPVRDDGRFSMTLFQQQMDALAASYDEIAPYIEYGTFYAHIMFDEPCDTVKWGGNGRLCSKLGNPQKEF